MKAETLRSALGLILVMLLCYFLQSAFFSRLPIFGAAPLLLPLVAVAAGLLGSSGWGGAFGLLCGILCDAALGGGGLVFTVALTVMGFFSGFLGDFILARGFPSYLLLSVCALLLSAFIQMFRLLVFDGRHGISASDAGGRFLERNHLPHAGRRRERRHGLQRRGGEPERVGREV